MILMIAAGASAVLWLPSPPSRAALLAREGVQIDAAAPLRLVSPRFERIGDRIRVSATLANGSATTQPAPPLRLRLLDAGGRAVATVTHVPPEGFVPADGQLHVGFETRAPDGTNAARLALVDGPDAIEEPSR